MRSLRLILPLSLFSLLAGTTASAATVAGRVVVRVGDTPMGVAGTTVASLQPPFVESDGVVGVSGFLVTANEGFVFRNDQVIFTNSEAVGVTLTGLEAPIGTAEGDLYVISPNVGANDALFANGALVGRGGLPAPGVPGVNAMSFIRPSMVDNGASYWVMSLASGGRVFATSPDGTAANAVPLLQAGDNLGGSLIDSGAEGIQAEYLVSYDGVHYINVITVDGGQEAIAVDEVIVRRALTPADPLTNWETFDLVSINNGGHYAFSGDTDGGTTTDEFIAYDGAIILREGATVDGVALAADASVGTLSLDDNGNLLHKWSGSAMTETVFISCGLGTGTLTSHVVLADGDLIDIDDDGVGDVTITDFEATSATAQRGLGNNGLVYFEVDLDGGEADEAIIEVTAPSCCGNGVEQAGEECDDGNVANGDACVSCADAICGDGFIFAGNEDCDDAGESADCDDDCTPSSCGDLNVNEAAGEDCDTGGVETETCNADCTTSTCGDGNINEAAGEECDDSGESDACDDDCSFVICGDNNTNEAAGEDCDTDAEDSATCDFDCSAATCGDGYTNTVAGETCDTTDKTDECDGDCTAVSCGDGHVNAPSGEECDGDGDGTPGETDECDEDCTNALCGDEVINETAGEECDDGNEDDGDGCSSECVVEAGTSTGEETTTGGETETGTPTTGDTETGEPTGGSQGSSSSDSDTEGTSATGSASNTSPTSTSPSTTEATSGDTDTDTDGGGGVGNDGCGCSTDGAKPVPAALLGLLFLGFTRRRRRA